MIVDTARNIIQTINTIPIYNKSVIVYDIDDTLIDYSGNPITPIIDTYHYASAKGLTPIIITARPGTEQNIELTRMQLSMHGITSYKTMYFMPPDKTDPVKYKYYARKNIHERGYIVAISIGDKFWDIGDYGGIGFIV